MTVNSLKELIKHYHDLSEGVGDYFEYLPRLVGEFPLDVALSYVFAQVELAHNMALYCGTVKLHKADADLARRAVNAHHMTRGDFQEKFENVFGKPLPKATVAKLKAAEDIRDKVMHGKAASDAEKRNAIASVLSYAAEFNDIVDGVGRFRPFGGLRGFKGRGQSLDPETTRWILKGMGFSLK